MIVMRQDPETLGIRLNVVESVEGMLLFSPTV